MSRLYVIAEERDGSERVVGVCLSEASASRFIEPYKDRNLYYYSTLMIEDEYEVDYMSISAYLTLKNKLSKTQNRLGNVRGALRKAKERVRMLESAGSGEQTAEQTIQDNLELALIRG